MRSRWLSFIIIGRKGKCGTFGMIRVQSSKNLHLVIPFSDVSQVVYFFKASSPARYTKTQSYIFRIGGSRISRRGAPNSQRGYFIKFMCQNNWVLLEHPLDPPMVGHEACVRYLTITARSKDGFNIFAFLAGW